MKHTKFSIRLRRLGYTKDHTNGGTQWAVKIRDWEGKPGWFSSIG